MPHISGFAFQDYLEYAQSQLGMKPLKKSYFYDAMDHFRAEYDHVAFLWVSDDMDWARRNIRDRHGDLHFAGDNSGNSNKGNIDFEIYFIISKFIFNLILFSSVYYLSNY